MERRVNNRTLAILLGVASATGLSAVAAWYQASAALRESHAQVIRDELQPIATRLTEDQEILEELQTEPFTEKNSGILESYLAKIRRDGVAKYADLKQRLDTLVENNTAIVTLIEAYARMRRRRRSRRKATSSATTTPRGATGGTRSWNSSWPVAIMACQVCPCLTVSRRPYRPRSRQRNRPTLRRRNIRRSF